MKNFINKKIIFASLFLLSFFSCSDDFIDIPNESLLTDESFWQNEEHVQQALTAAYGALQGYDGSKWTFFEEVFIGITYRSDEVDNNKGESYGRALGSFTNTTEESTGYNLWKSGYAGIGRANQIIQRVPSIDGISDAQKDAFVGEAKFLRALYYFYLVNSFENIPLVTTYETDPALLTPSQVDAQEVWDQIEADLMDAEASLPDLYNEDNAGRATKWAAKSLLGKTYLYQEKWALAEAKFGEVVASTKFSLLPNFEDNFNGAGENGSESIFEIQFSGDRSNGNDERHPMNYEVTPYALGGWELFYPSVWLVDEMKTDLTAGGEFSDRVYESVYFDDANSVMYNLDAETWVPYADVKIDLNNPLYFKKYSYSLDVDYYGGTNITLIRYADVKLMYAEALNENNKPAEALQQVNDVRDRSNAMALGVMTKDALRTQIRHHERPCELAMEYGIRWFDLNRWSKGTTAAESVKNTLQLHGKPFTTNFVTGKHEVNPIPLQEMNVNKNLVQNDNW